MADIAELRDSVMHDPNDFDVRWRLAKKLYLACEYQQALDHLQVLKAKWSRRLNVLRYLGATYYRLGMYNESIEELRDALAMWPTEVGVMEQLARVYEAAGRREEAAAVWEDIVRTKTDHPVASSAIRRLRKRSDSAVESLRLGDGDSGIHLATGISCEQCGARNSPDFERCWQCHAQLTRTTPKPQARQIKAYNTSQLPPILIWTANAILLAGGAYITAVNMHFLPYPAGDQADQFTVYGVLSEALGIPRVISGVILLVLWPITLDFMLRQVKAGSQRPVGPLATGVFLASLTYLTFWAPVQLLPFAPIAMGMISLVVILLLLNLEFRHALQIWGVQAIVALITSLVALTAFEGIRVLTEAYTIVSYAAGFDGGAPGDRVTYTEPSTPIESAVVWESTGSTWLDEQGATVQFRIELDETPRPPNAELSDDTNLKAYKALTSNTNVLTAQGIVPGKKYIFRIKGDDGIKLRITAAGIMRARFVQ